LISALLSPPTETLFETSELDDESDSPQFPLLILISALLLSPTETLFEVSLSVQLVIFIFALFSPSILTSFETPSLSSEESSVVVSLEESVVEDEVEELSVELSVSEESSSSFDV
jgi:hypothetical protein